MNGDRQGLNYRYFLLICRRSSVAIESLQIRHMGLGHLADRARQMQLEGRRRELDTPQAMLIRHGNPTDNGTDDSDKSLVGPA